MSKKRPNPELVDEENPELTDADYARMRSASEVLPHLVEAWKKGELKVRGPQKAPTKARISLRLSREVVAYFKEGGKGWQSRIDQALLEMVHHHKAG